MIVDVIEGNCQKTQKMANSRISTLSVKKAKKLIKMAKLTYKRII